MPSKKEVTRKPAVKKAAAKQKPAKPVNKVVKKASAKKPAKAQSGATNSVNFSIQPRELLEKKALDKGESVEELITKRKVELMSVDDYLGVQKKQDYRNKPAIPGVYDLLIPPGTPRKLIIRLAKEHPVQIIRRDDIFVPVGVCDIERDLLAIRGDEKTIRKMEKLLLQEIDSYIEGRDARLHDYTKPVKLDGIGMPGKKPKRSKA